MVWQMTSYSIFQPQSQPWRLTADEGVFDQALLEELRPWLKVESARSVGDGRNLEAWSCFSSRGFQFVSHTLMLATTRGSSPTGITHARAWKLSEIPPKIDPAAVLGRTDAFISS